MDTRTLFARLLFEDCKADGIQQLSIGHEDPNGAQFALRRPSDGCELARAVQISPARFEVRTYDPFWGRWLPHASGLIPSEVAELALRLIEGDPS